MADEIKYMDLTAFVNEGYLQEVNRQFFHPLGLALSVECDDDGNATAFGGVWDYRDDKKGMTFADGVIDRKKALRIAYDQKAREDFRNSVLGFNQQPVPDLGIQTDDNEEDKPCT